MGDSNPSELILAVQGPEQMRSFPKKWVRAAIAKGDIKRSQLIWSPNHNEWKQLRDLPHLMPTMEIAPLPPLVGEIDTPGPVRNIDMAVNRAPTPRVSTTESVKVAQPVPKPTPTGGIAKVAVPTVAKAAVPTAVKVAAASPAGTPAPVAIAQATSNPVAAKATTSAPVVQPATAQPTVAKSNTPSATIPKISSVAMQQTVQPATAKPRETHQPVVSVNSPQVATPAVQQAPAKPAVSENASPKTAPSPKTPSLKKVASERDYILPIARVVAGCSFLILVALVGGNYFLVESPFAQQLTANGLSKVSAYASFGGFYQLDILTIHLTPSAELKRETFAKTLIGLAKSSPRTSVDGQGWTVVSLTPGLSGGYIVQGNDWKDLAALANQPEIQQKLYILGVVHDYNNAFLLDSPPAVDPTRTELTDRESRAWNLLVKTFIP